MTETGSRHADVVVVGGGPAGSTAGGLLAQRGRSVILLDRARFPRPKPCGETINPGAVIVLDRLGLLEDVLALGPSRIDGWMLGSDSAPPVRGRFPSGVTALGVPRARLDHALLDAARARGVEVVEGARVIGLERRPNGRRTVVAVRHDDGRRSLVTAAAVVGADGLRSRIAVAAGLVRRPPRLRKVSLTCRIEGTGPATGHGTLSLSDRGVVGVVPVDAHGARWNVTVVADPARDGRAVATDPAGYLLARLRATEIPWDAEPRIAGGPWASGPFDRPVHRATDVGLVLVGDAAGYYDPFTGQGIFRALRSAELAAGTLDGALRSGDVGRTALEPYDGALRRAFGPGRRLQRAIEAGLGDRRTREFLLGVLGRQPELLDGLLEVTGDLRPVRSLAGVAWRAGTIPRIGVA